MPDQSACVEGKSPCLPFIFLCSAVAARPSATLGLPYHKSDLFEAKPSVPLVLETDFSRSVQENPAGWLGSYPRGRPYRRARQRAARSSPSEAPVRSLEALSRSTMFTSTPGPPADRADCRAMIGGRCDDRSTVAATRTQFAYLPAIILRQAAQSARVAHRVAHARFRPHPQNSEATRKLKLINGLFGERGGNRTHDPLIKSQMLYLLSYALALRPEGPAPRAYSLIRDGSTPMSAFNRAVRAARSRAKSSPAWCEERVSGDDDTSRKPLAAPIAA